MKRKSNFDSMLKSLFINESNFKIFISGESLTDFSKNRINALLQEYIKSNKIPITKNDNNIITRSIFNLDAVFVNLLWFLFCDKQIDSIDILNKSEKLMKDMFKDMKQIVRRKGDVINELKYRSDQRDYFKEEYDKKETVSQKYTEKHFTEYLKLYEGNYKETFGKLQVIFPELINRKYKNFHTRFLAKYPNKKPIKPT